MFSFLFIGIAAMCWAVIDTLSHHFSTSVFQKLNPNFWNPNISWITSYSVPVLNVDMDAWHIIKYFILGSFFLAVVLYKSVVNQFVDISIMCIEWWVIFELFYSKILRRKYSGTK